MFRPSKNQLGQYCFAAKKIKKDGAAAITDFRPISLIHSFVKIITKALALRLAGLLLS